MPATKDVEVVRRKPSEKKGEENYVELAIKGINKALDSDCAATVLSDQGGEDGLPVMGWVRTGIWPLDYLISNFRGIPLGRSMLIWGPESSGKSSLCHFLLYVFQRAGFTNAYFDYDDAVDREMVERGGVDLTKVIFPAIGTLEEGFDALGGIATEFYGKMHGVRKLKKKDLRAMMKKNENRKLAALWDSLWASVPQALLDQTDAKKSLVGVEARAFSLQFKKLRMMLRGRPMVVIFTNEAREAIGGMTAWGPQTKSPGGRAVRHYPTTILRLAKVETVRKEKHGRKKTVGMWIEATAQKTRFGPMMGKARFYISFSKTPGKSGPSPAESNFEFLKSMNFLTSKKIKDKSGEKSEPGYKIKGVDEAGVFTKKEWPDVMRQHSKKILGMLRKELVADSEAEESSG